MADQFLMENGATFPTILDTSDDAMKLSGEMESIGMSAVPLTYIIGKGRPDYRRVVWVPRE